MITPLGIVKGIHKLVAIDSDRIALLKTLEYDIRARVQEIITTYSDGSPERIQYCGLDEDIGVFSISVIVPSINSDLVKELDAFHDQIDSILTTEGQPYYPIAINYTEE